MAPVPGGPCVDRDRRIGPPLASASLGAPVAPSGVLVVRPRNETGVRALDVYWLYFPAHWTSCIVTALTLACPGGGTVKHRSGRLRAVVASVSLVSISLMAAGPA